MTVRECGFKYTSPLRKAIFEQEKVRFSATTGPISSVRFESAERTGERLGSRAWAGADTAASARRYQTLSHARIAPRHQGYRVEVRHPATF